MSAVQSIEQPLRFPFVGHGAGNAAVRAISERLRTIANPIKAGLAPDQLALDVEAGFIGRAMWFGHGVFSEWARGSSRIMRLSNSVI